MQMGLLGHPSKCCRAVASGAGRRRTRRAIVEQMGPELGTKDAGPTSIRPCAPLDDYVESIGDWRCPDVDYWSRALPRGAVTVIFDVGQRQQLHFYAADGTTRLTVPPAFVIGSHTAPYVSNIMAGEPVMAVHFRPGGAFPFLGIPLGNLEDRYVGIDEIWGSDGRDLHERLIETSSTQARFRVLELFLMTRPRLSADRQAGVAATMAAIEDNPSVRMADIHNRVGISAKRLIALFRDEVGLSPKAYARVRRLQAALRLLGAGAVGGAQVAAEIGYFDQAHFVRDFASFTGMTPTQYAAQRILLPSHVPVERPKFTRRPVTSCA
jgi:AraC-like DNA-binding protein